KAGGVSRRIEGEDRQAIKEALDHLNVPDDMGLIVRTAGLGRDAEELQWDLDYLMQLWKSISEAATTRSSPFLIYQESRLIIRALRDYLRGDIGEILIDNEELFQEARDFMQQVMPNNLRKLKLYTDTTPLFSRYQIETQIENAFERQVRLPAGGSIVIDQTEALTAIDINSSRATKGSDIEDTAFHTNCEAAVEIARQLRIRDAGGLIVIDFIDMDSPRHQREVEDKLKDALKHDRARVQIGRISRFGLLEMSRQRLRPSLGEATQIVCPRCEGHGSIRSVESLSLSALRLAEEHAMKDSTGQVLLQAPPDVANFLLNEKRKQLSEIEARHNVALIVVADINLETPHLEIQRLRGADLGDTPQPSYQRLTPVAATALPQMATPGVEAEQPAVSRVAPMQPAPQRPDMSEPANVAAERKEPAGKGFFAAISAWFAGSSEPATPQKAKPAKRSDSGRAGSDRNERGQRPRRDSERRPGSTGQGTRQPKPDRAERGERDKDSAGGGGRGGRQNESARTSKRRGERSTGGSSSSTTERASGSGRNTTKSESAATEEKAAIAAVAAVSVADVAADETKVDVAVTSSDTQASENASTDDNKETGKTRRRGRRGGRRRRKDSATATEDGGDANDESVKATFDDEDGEDNDLPKRGRGSKAAGASAAVAATATANDSDSNDAGETSATDAVEPTRTPKILDAVKAVETAQASSSEAPGTDASAVVAHKSSADSVVAAKAADTTISPVAAAERPSRESRDSVSEPVVDTPNAAIPVADASNTNDDQVKAVQATVDPSVDQVKKSPDAESAPPARAEPVQARNAEIAPNNVGDQPGLPLSTPDEDSPARASSNAVDVNDEKSASDEDRAAPPSTP
ncbi:MAG: Rne/Rng family ribonuclease, partial [Dokdonella sp.]